MRGSAASAATSHSWTSPRVIASRPGEGLVEQQDGLVGEQRADEGDALAHPARQLARQGVARSPRGRGARRAARRGRARLRGARRGFAAPARRCRSRAARGAAGRAAACRRSARAARRRPRRRRPRSARPPARRGRRSARAGSTCRTPTARRARRPLPARRARSRRRMTSSSPKAWRRPVDGDGGAPAECGLGGRMRVEALPREPPVCCSCSLRANYRTGSKGQRRVGLGAISARLPASPPGSLRREV